MKFSWRHPCSKSSSVQEPVKLSLIKKGKKKSVSVIQESIPHMAAVKDRENRPSLFEPVEIDCPIRCPQPERGILHDGRIFKERLKVAAKTKGDFTFLTEKEVKGVLQRESHSFSDRLIFPSASAPEPSISHLLEMFMGHSEDYM